VQGVESQAGWGKLGGKVYRRIVSVLGVLIFGAILYYGGLEALRRVARIDLRYLACAFVGAALAAFVTSLRWGLIVDALEGSAAGSRLHYFYYVMMGKLSSTFVSQYVGDYGVRPLALKASGKTTVGRAVYSVFLDRLFDLILSLLFLVPGLLFLGRVVSAEVLSALILLSVGTYWVVSGRNRWLLPRLVGAAVDALRGRGTALPLVGPLIGKVVRTLDGASEGLEQVSEKCINSANVLTMFRYLGMAVRAYFVALALGLSIPFWLIFLAVGLVRFTLLFAVAPGRLGVLEVGWYGVLALGGVAASSIVPFLIGLRVYGLVFNAIMALAAHLAVSLRSNRAG
jgi:uncharacterized protein (TIRG00374 family)